MIGEIIKLVQLAEYEGSSEIVKAAKGKYQYPTDFKKIWRHVKDRSNGRR